MSLSRHRLHLVLPLLLLLTGLLALVPQVHHAAAATDGPIIVSIGDSVASGEGAPDVPHTYLGQIYPPTGWLGFSDGNVNISDPGVCHRSNNAGPAQAFFQRIKVALPNATFVSAACSGAGIFNGLTQTQLKDDGTPKVNAPQLQQVANWMAANRPGRRIDALFVSIGANDAGFGDVVLQCMNPLKLVACENDPTFVAQETQKLANLALQYDGLAWAIQNTLNPVKVYITDYFDPTQKAAGVFCNGEPVGDPLSFISGDEAQWASQFVIAKLNANVEAAAQRNAAHGWQAVTGIAPSFIGHAYCSGNKRFVNTVDDSLLLQGDRDGSVHPNTRGYAVYRDFIANTFLSTRLSLIPTILSQSHPTYNSVQLSWEDHSGSATRYEVSVSGWVNPVPLPAATTSWQQDNLTPGVTYAYQVRACNAGGCAPFSNQVFYTVPAPPSPIPAAPSNLTDTPTPSGTLYKHTLSWTLNSANQTSVVLYYQDDTTTTWNTIPMPSATTTQYVLGTAFKLYHAYNIYVQACNANGCSAPSNTIWVDIQTAL
jgi:hypothetical protein